MTNTTSSSIRLTKSDYFKAIEAMMQGASSYVVKKNDKEATIDAGMIVEFCINERDLLDRKSKVDKKPTAKQNANEEIKNAIMALMSDGVERTVSTIMKDCPECAEFSNQRASALVRQLKDEGKLERKEIKRVAYFVKVGD